ncbi:hypothetical protein D3C86_1113300 [compost metagenome]
MAVADASLRISIDSMSCGLMKLLFGFSIGKPSMTYKGELSCVTDPAPRMVMLMADPGCPSTELTFTPATRPAKASSKDRTGAFCIFSTGALATEPVTSALVVVP